MDYITKHRKIIISFVAGMIFLAIALHGYTIYNVNQRSIQNERNIGEIVRWVNGVIKEN